MEIQVHEGNGRLAHREPSPEEIAYWRHGQREERDRCRPRSDFDPFNELEHQTGLPSHIRLRSQKGRAWREGDITVPDLVFLGWTEATISRRLGPSDVVRPLVGNGYRGTMRLYDRSRMRIQLSNPAVRFALRERLIRRQNKHWPRSGNVVRLLSAYSHAA